MNILRIYSCLVLILIPFWTLPFLPGSYKPISVFMVFPLGIFFLLSNILHKKKISKPDFILFVFFVLSILYSFILFFFSETLFFNQFVIGITLFVIGIFSFFGFRFVLGNLSIELIFQCVKISIFIIAVVGIIDILSLYGFIPRNIGDFLNTIFSGKGSSRIILTVSEPAWASRLILCYFPFAFYFYTLSKSNLDLFLLILFASFFIVTFSLSGIVVAIFTAFLFYIKNFSFRYLLRLFFIVTILLLSFYLMFQYLKSDGGYFVSRFQKFSEINPASIFDLNLLATLDGSAFIRIGYPIIAFDVFKANPFGVGVGQYGSYFIQQIYQYGSAVYSNIQVHEHIVGGNADQRSFYLKILTEVGIVGALLIFLFFFSIYRKINQINDESVKFLLIFLFFIMLSNMIQFGSYLFVFYWFVPALILRIYER